MKCTPLLTLIRIYFIKSYYNEWGSTLPGILYIETQSFYNVLTQKLRQTAKNCFHNRILQL